MPARLARMLPAHMVPARLIVLPDLPRRPNGKLDQKSLPDPGNGSSALSTAPAGEIIEIFLASIWRGCWACSRVGAHDDFFELGGDSILSLRAVSQARQGGLDLTPRGPVPESTRARRAGGRPAARDARAPRMTRRPADRRR